MAVYTQRHQIADAIGKIGQDALQKLIDDCVAGEMESAKINEMKFDRSDFDEWLNRTIELKRREQYREHVYDKLLDAVIDDDADLKHQARTVRAEIDQAYRIAEEFTDEREAR